MLYSGSQNILMVCIAAVHDGEAGLKHTWSNTSNTILKYMLVKVTNIKFEISIDGL